MIDKKKKNKSLPIEEKLSRREKLAQYKLNQRIKFERQKEYFASDQKDNEQSKRDDEFFKKIIRIGIVFAILAFLYHLFIR